MRNARLTKSFRLLFLFLLIPVFAFSQTITIQGVVKDVTGEGLPGVAISEIGTSNGTFSDIDGKFTLNVSSKGKIRVSFISYQTQEINVDGKVQFNIILEEDAKALDEVVVVGYGTMKRSDLTGAVTSVTSDAISRSVPTTVDQVLQGRAAGVQVQQNSGMPGASTSIRIRGINSISSSNEPIYVIDGVIIDGGATSQNSTNTNALANINPADIVTLDILKDASATAIYGSRAANGVIMITTKRGRKGEASITYNGYIGWQQIPEKLDLLNLRQYAEHRNVLAENGTATWNNNFVRPDLLGEGTDWQSELFNTATMHSHNISISGGSDKITYALGAGYMNQDGIAAGSGFKRLNLSGSFDSQVKTWLKAGINFAFANTNQKLTVSDRSLIATALRMTPDVPVRNVDGSFAGSDQQFMPVNPMALASLVKNSVEIADIRANTYLEASILPELTYRTELSFDISTNNGSYFQPTYYLSQTQFLDVNEGRYTKQYNKYWSWRNILTYNKTFGVHAVTAMLGQEMSKSTWEYLLGSRNGFPSNISTGLTLGDATTAYNDGYDGEASLASVFGRLFYSFDDRYLLTATLRRDGSSKFARDKRWGWFPSAAFAWKISNENFLKDNQVINNLKLRLGYGLVGNQAIPTNNAYIASYGTTATNWGTGLIATNIPNPDLTWESTSSGNIGIDLNLFKNRIEFIADLYYKKTNNLLMEASLPGFAGTNGQGALGKPWVNLGSLENKGIELTLNTVNIDKKDFLWRSNFIFSLNRNKVRSINTVSGIITGSTNGNSWGVTESVVVNRTMVGRPIGEFYGYQVIGRFEKATDFYYTDKDGKIKNTPVRAGLDINETTGVWIGDYIYKDQNGDGMITEDDRAVIGNPEPKFTFGIGNTFSYKGFDLSISLSGSYGNDVINYAQRFMGNPYRNTSNLFTSAFDYARLDLIDPGMGNDYRNVKIVGGDPHAPRLALGTKTSDYNFVFSDRFVEDGSYLRIQNISFGYNLPRALISKAGIQNLKIYTNIQNLYTFTKYKGYDPEVGSTYVDGNWLNGYDDGRYPSPRIYTVGINATF
ncbi:SusC/RagA family TonB-linked outer membrane protein [Bacteroidia bacterium]|nr:SusC/RagA family TonB-linked outer membrane protein [Bacteroidia bacterium]